MFRLRRDMKTGREFRWMHFGYAFSIARVPIPVHNIYMLDAQPKFKKKTHTNWLSDYFRFPLKPTHTQTAGIRQSSKMWKLTQPSSSNKDLCFRRFFFRTAEWMRMLFFSRVVTFFLCLFLCIGRYVFSRPTISWEYTRRRVSFFYGWCAIGLLCAPNELELAANISFENAKRSVCNVYSLALWST